MSIDDAIRQLRQLNEPVPKPMRLPTTSEVEDAQQKLGIPFHPDYRRYLLEASDIVYGALEPCTVTAGGDHTDLVKVAEAAWTQAGVPRNLLPICEDNGDHYCMNQSGEVVFWSHNGYTDERWRDLATWIEQVWIGEG